MAATKVRDDQVTEKIERIPYIYETLAQWENGGTNSVTNQILPVGTALPSGAAVIKLYEQVLPHVAFAAIVPAVITDTEPSTGVDGTLYFVYEP